MKLSISCPVEGEVELAGSIQVTAGPYEYTFERDSSGLLRHLAIVARVDPTRVSTSFTDSKGDEPAEIVFEPDEKLVSRMRSRIQALESHLAFRLPVERIRWDSARFELIFESDEERSGHSIYSLHVDRAGARRERASADTRTIYRSLVACDRFADLTIPLAFLREGNNEYFSGRYITAFYNFYFILEGLYGAGKWRNRAVEQAFIKSPSFGGAVEGAARLLRKELPRLYDAVLQEVGSSEEELDPASVARKLVEARGSLHHYSGKLHKRGPTPFAHEDYKIMCTLARFVATYSVTLEMIDVTNSEGGG